MSSIISYQNGAILSSDSLNSIIFDFCAIKECRTNGTAACFMINNVEFHQIRGLCFSRMMASTHFTEAVSSSFGAHIVDLTSITQCPETPTGSYTLTTYGGLSATFTQTNFSCNYLIKHTVFQCAHSPSTNLNLLTFVANIASEIYDHQGGEHYVRDNNVVNNSDKIRPAEGLIFRARSVSHFKECVFIENDFLKFVHIFDGDGEVTGENLTFFGNRFSWGTELVVANASMKPFTMTLSVVEGWECLTPMWYTVGFSVKGIKDGLVGNILWLAMYQE